MYKLSPIDPSGTPSISIISTSASSSTTSYTSPPSTPSTGSPTPTPSPNPQQSLSVRPAVSRQRSATMGSSGDRVMRKRRRQRECDIQRRQKENVGFNRLYTLLTSGAMKKQQKLIRQQQQEDDDGSGDEDTDRKMNKADILHESAERIEKLERMLVELTEATTRRNSLESSMFMHSSACIVVIHVPSGFMTDASERYLQHTLMERSWLVGRRFFPPQHLMSTNPMYLTRPYPSNSHQADRVLCRPGRGALQETQQSPQSEKSVRQLHQLYAGEIDTMCAVWRSQFGDGRVMEKTVHSWVTEWDEHTDGTPRTPLYVIGLVSTSETVCVE